MSFDEDKNWENFLLEVAEKRQEHGMTHKDFGRQCRDGREDDLPAAFGADQKSKPFSCRFRMPSAAHIYRQTFCEGSIQKSRQPEQRRNGRDAERAGAPAQEADQHTFRSYIRPAGDDDYIPRPDRCK